MGYINEKILQLEREIITLRDRLNTVEGDSKEANLPNVHTVVGGNKDNALNFPIDITTGLGGTYGNFMPWNDAELVLPAYNTVPGTPTKGYHRHTHSRYAGGALNIGFLELVEYDVETWGESYNPHCQQFWNPDPTIKTMENSDGERVDKIGRLYLEFDANAGLWFAGIREIDVERTMFVKKDDDGVIEEDENENQMKSAIYVDNEQTTNLTWDEVAQMWRMYAVYAEDPEEEEA